MIPPNNQHDPIKSPACLYDSTKEPKEEVKPEPTIINEEVRVNASSDTENCPNCGGWGGGAWNGNDSPFESYLPCYKCGL